MGAIKVIIMEKYLRPLEKMAKEFGIGKSDLFNEMAEWVLDQEDVFRKDLKASLEGSDEEEVSEEDVSDSEDNEEEIEEEAE